MKLRIFIASDNKITQNTLKSMVDALTKDCDIRLGTICEASLTIDLTDNYHIYIVDKASSQSKELDKIKTIQKSNSNKALSQSDLEADQPDEFLVQRQVCFVHNDVNKDDDHIENVLPKMLEDYYPQHLDLTKRASFMITPDMGHTSLAISSVITTHPSTTPSPSAFADRKVDVKARHKSDIDLGIGKIATVMFDFRIKPKTGPSGGAIIGPLQQILNLNPAPTIEIARAIASPPPAENKQSAVATTQAAEIITARPVSPPLPGMAITANKALQQEQTARESKTQKTISTDNLTIATARTNSNPPSPQVTAALSASNPLSSLLTEEPLERPPTRRGGLFAPPAPPLPPDDGGCNCFGRRRI